MQDDATPRSSAERSTACMTVMNELHAWLIAGGAIIHPDVEMASDSNGSYLRARSGHDIAAESSLISCPHSLMISWHQVMHGSDEFLRHFDLQRAFHLINESVIIRFFLIRQHVLKEKSRWWPYIRSLPQPDATDHLDTPLWYGSEDLLWIRGTNLEFGAKTKERMWRQEYEEGMRLLIPAADEPAELWSWSWHLYKWAATIFSSRAFLGSAVANTNPVQGSPSTSTTLALHQPFFGEKGNNVDFACPVLIPGFDLMNHNPAAKVTWIWGHSECSFSNNEAIGGGNQIWNNYGPKSNEELIMGYGFSVFRNSADVCVLALSSESRQRLKETGTNLIEQDGRHSVTAGVFDMNPSDTMAQAGSGNRIPSSPNLVMDNLAQMNKEQERMMSDSGQTSEMEHELHWIRSNISSDYAGQCSKSTYEFSPHFLKDCSKMFANKREIISSTFYSQASVDFSGDELSRNKFHVICAVTMILQKQLKAIIQHNHKLPRWPESIKAFHAARYRRNQVDLLSVLTTHFLKRLRTLVGVDLLPGRDGRLIRLEHILTQSPQGHLLDFRAALHVGLGTRNPAKIRSNGWVECTFTLWLCGLWSWRTSKRQELESSRDPNSTSYILNWLCFLERVYGHPCEVKDDEEMIPQGNDSEGLEEPIHTWDAGPNTLDSKTDSVLVAKSYQAVVDAALKKNAHSLYGSPDVTLARLVWCLDIIREEGVMVPNLEGKMDEEDDEFILFMEIGNSC